jgi:(E)-4-hydroxy-3-methylbut-2-enyl-diphosphate synthase
MIKRRKTHRVQVGNIGIGGQEPIRIQSMANTPTADVEATADQVLALWEAGSELVRITVDTENAAKAVPEIKRRVRAAGSPVPLIGDFHYNGHLLLKEHPAMAESLDKYRINPGNVGKGDGREAGFRSICEAACRLGKPVRIGVNGGSLDQDLLGEMMRENAQKTPGKDPEEVLCECMITSALESADLASECGLKKDQIVLSCKVSHPLPLIRLYRRLSIKTDAPLHLGLTEAGLGTKGIVASSAALAVLLEEGIGDTIRISLTPLPGGERSEEVRVAQELLQSLGSRSFSPTVTACPGCGRTTSELYEQIARDVELYVKKNLNVWKKKYSGIEDLKIAVMGCVVNGPGEAKSADIGISLPGRGEKPQALVFRDGKKIATLKGDKDRLIWGFTKQIESYIQDKF